MPFEPTAFIAEILGQPAAEMRNPVNAGYQCPYINSQCTKRSQRIEGPYPVCTIYRWRGRVREGKPTSADPTCVCPKRFLEADILDEVVNHCWPGPAPGNPQYVHEIKMEGFGNVDFVIADIDRDEKVRQFVSVELQAVDITGSIMPAYEAHLNSRKLETKPSYGFNFANVYKRYVTQLIGKGYFHHHWGTRIVSVIQDVIFNDIYKRTRFPTIPLEQSNIVFMSYKYVPAEEPGHLKLELDKIVPTHHSNLQSAILYQTPPSKDEFCARIENQLKKGHVGKPIEPEEPVEES